MSQVTAPQLGPATEWLRDEQLLANGWAAPRISRDVLDAVCGGGDGGGRRDRGGKGPAHGLAAGRDIGVEVDGYGGSQGGVVGVGRTPCGSDSVIPGTVLDDSDDHAAGTAGGSVRNAATRGPTPCVRSRGLAPASVCATPSSHWLPMHACRSAGLAGGGRGMGEGVGMGPALPRGMGKGAGSAGGAGAGGGQQRQGSGGATGGVVGASAVKSLSLQLGLGVLPGNADAAGMRGGAAAEGGGVGEGAAVGWPPLGTGGIMLGLDMDGDQVAVGGGRRGSRKRLPLGPLLDAAAGEGGGLGG